MSKAKEIVEHLLEDARILNFKRGIDKNNLISSCECPGCPKHSGECLSKSEVILTKSDDGGLGFIDDEGDGFGFCHECAKSVQQSGGYY